MKRSGYVLTVSAIVLSSLLPMAFSAASAQAFAWSIEEAGALETGESAAVTLGLKTGTTAVLTGKILGAELEVKATGLSGVETKIEGETAKDSGKYKLEGVSVVKPAGCKVAATLETNALKGEIVKVGETLYDKLVPAAKEGPFLTLKLTGCASEGNYKLTGTEYAQVEPVETELVEQPLKFSPAILKAAGGSLLLAGEPATLTMEVVAKLQAPNAGRRFVVIPAAPKYRALEPAAITGVQLSEQHFGFKAKLFACKKTSLAANILVVTRLFPLTPVSYTECFFEGLSAEVKPEGCEYELGKPIFAVGGIYSADMRIICPATKSMKFIAKNMGGVVVCEMSVGPQANLGWFRLESKAGPPRWILAKAELGNFAYSITVAGAGCPLAAVENRNDGTYGGEISLTAEAGNELFIQ